MAAGERWLILFLRFNAAVLLLALPAALLPTQWMADTHEFLGLGTFPDTALTQYLTRSASLVYAMHGVVVLLCSFDVQRFRPLIAGLGWLDVAFGVGMLLVDIAAGLPWYWTAAEGPSVAVNGLVILWLLRRTAPIHPPREVL